MLTICLQYSPRNLQQSICSEESKVVFMNFHLHDPDMICFISHFMNVNVYSIESVERYIWKQMLLFDDIPRISWKHQFILSYLKNPNLRRSLSLSIKRYRVKLQWSARRRVLEKSILHKLYLITSKSLKKKTLIQLKCLLRQSIHHIANCR